MFVQTIRLIKRILYMVRVKATEIFINNNVDGGSGIAMPTTTIKIKQKAEKSGTTYTIMI